MSGFTRTGKPAGLILSSALAVFFCIFPLYGEAPQRPPINVNLIIDSSQTFLDANEEITSWVCNRLDQILANGDRLIIWNAGSTVRVIYSGTINSNTDRENAKSSIREISASDNGIAGNVNLSGALREAAARESSSYSYTLLINTSREALSSVLEGPQANLLRFSRVEEFSSWRAFVVGLDLNTRVRRAAAAFFGS
jgi:hypothetical protein